jgi:hypothetical protein
MLIKGEYHSKRGISEHTLQADRRQCIHHITYLQSLRFSVEISKRDIYFVQHLISREQMPDTILHNVNSPGCNLSHVQFTTDAKELAHITTPPPSVAFPLYYCGSSC